MPEKTFTKKSAINEETIERWRNSDLLLIGGSAGSFKIVLSIIRLLPSTLNKSVIIIMHRRRNFASEIERLFSENTKLKINELCDKDNIYKNTIYIVPANYHTLIEKEKTFSLDVSDPVWYSKPSIDVTFESAAEVYGDKCTAILLSGANQDGAAGLLKLREKGALTIVQNPDEAEMPEMPLAAISLNAAAHIFTTRDIFELLSLQTSI